MFHLRNVLTMEPQPGGCVPQDHSLNSKDRIPGEALNDHIAITALGRATRCSQVYRLHEDGGCIVAATSDLPA